jgi:DNA polymerase III subunit delta'
MWSDVIGQLRAKEIIQRAIQTGRIAHAYCFWGNEGIGKDAFALEFAKVVNCFEQQTINGQLEACGVCKSCVQASHLQHPNISLVFSLPSGKSSSSDDDSPLLRLSDEQIASIQEQLALKAQNPYHNITISQANQIKIASIRDVKKTIQFSQSQQGRRFIIISEADEMTTEAANAFLKTLEEPQDNVTLIITTSHKDQLPQTILSRCQLLYFEPLPPDDIANFLVKHEAIDKQHALLCATLSQGSISTAVEMLNADTQQLRNDIVDLLRATLRQTGYRQDVAHRLEELTRNSDRSDIEKMLLLLMVWLRDALMIILSNSADNIVNQDQRDVLEKFSQAFRNGNFTKALSEIELALHSLTINAQVNLTLLTLMISIRRAMIG